MNAWKVSLLALAVTLAGCDSDKIVIGPEPDPDPEPIECEGEQVLVDGICVDPAPIEPPPEPVETVSADDATTMTLALGTVSAETGTLEFDLATEGGEAITDLTSISVTYIGYPPEDWKAPRSSSNFKLGWHQNVLVDCTAGPCDGILEELEPGSYRFTPTKYHWHDDISRHKFGFSVAGAQVADEVTLTPFPTE